MKKFLLSLATVLCASAFASADITETFKYADGWLPALTTVEGASDNTTTATSPTTGIKYTLVACYCNSGYDYLMFGSKKLGTAASISFALPEKVTAIEFKTGSNASASAVYSVTAGETTVDAGTKWGKAATKTINLPAECQAAGTIITVTSTSTSYNGQISTINMSTVSAIESPTFSVEEGTYTAPINVTISAADDCAIYYTLDGSAPSDESTKYAGEPIEISEYTVLKAIAVNADDVASSVATATYAFQNTIATAMTVADAIAWISEGKDATTEQYVKGVITLITEVSTSYGNATYYIGDSEDATDTIQVFRGKYIDGEKFTAEDQIHVGDIVVIYGKLKDYNGTPEIDTNNYIVSQELSGIADVELDNNAPVEYFNLQGVRVANPENGLYIMRQGDKVVKVIK